VFLTVIGRLLVASVTTIPATIMIHIFIISSSFYLPNNTTVCTFTSIHFRRAGQQGPTRTLTAALKQLVFVHIGYCVVWTKMWLHGTVYVTSVLEQKKKFIFAPTQKVSYIFCLSAWWSTFAICMLGMANSKQVSAVANWPARQHRAVDRAWRSVR